MPGPEESLGQSQAAGVPAACTHDLAHRIPRGHRAAAFPGCSYEDISDILGVPEKTVKSRLFSARQQLKTALQRQGQIRELGR